MAKYRSALPQLEGGIFLSYCGMETDLIFNRGVDLPGFASYPLLESEFGREALRGYCSDYIALAQRRRVGLILDSPTWCANRDKASGIGYSGQRLREANRDAIRFISEMRDLYGDAPTVLNASIGPRDDAYEPERYMTANEAEVYHAEQIEVFADTNADMVSAFTLCYPEEAIGIVRAARRVGLPVAIGFTVETDGRLPNRLSLKDAIEAVDEATGKATAYYVINCAHPDHFSAVLTDAQWMERIIGIVANASRRSHAELDSAEELDDGDPLELGELFRKLRHRFPHLTIVGGCCGTDIRHVEAIAERVEGTAP
jgi:homocysteine S-methyltransferase